MLIWRLCVSRSGVDGTLTGSLASRITSVLSLHTSSLSCLVSSLELPHCFADFSLQPRERKIPPPPWYHWLLEGGGGIVFVLGSCLSLLKGDELAFHLHLFYFICMKLSFTSKNESVSVVWGLLSHFQLWQGCPG